MLGRDALYVAQGTVFRLINAHLDSLGDTVHYLANVLREPGCSSGIISTTSAPRVMSSSTRANWWVACLRANSVDVGRRARALGPGRPQFTTILKVMKPPPWPSWSNHWAYVDVPLPSEHC